MRLIPGSGLWKWSALAVAVFMTVFMSRSWLFENFDMPMFLAPGGTEEVVIPEHETEQGREYVDTAVQQEEFKGTADPIRKISVISKGESVYKILLQNSISHTQAFQVISEVRKVFDLARVVPGHELVVVFSPDNAVFKGLEYEISENDRLYVTIDADKVEAEKRTREKPSVWGYEGTLRQFNRVVRQGDTLYTILSSSGVSRGQINEVFRSVREIYNLAGLSRGNTLTIWTTKETPARLSRLIYEIDELNTLEVEAASGGFKASRKTQELSVRYERAEGRVNSSLYESAVQAGLSPEIIMGITDIFAWDINFFTDIREGDSYSVLYERYYVKNMFKGYGRVMAAKFVNQGREHVAVYYNDGKKIDGYYDETGKAIQKQFLKAPLNFRRISSGFSYRRMHPIFHVMRPHLGVDYAAPSGTPVVALGDGKVIFKGWSKGFGKCVQIRHPSGYITYYGHLRGFPKDVRSGSWMSQGEVIGYVGRTGNATGPHLDFRVRYAGKFLNPLTLKPVNGQPLKGDVLAHFKEISARRLAMMDDITLNYAAKLSSR